MAISMLEEIESDVHENLYVTTKTLAYVLHTLEG